MMYIYYTIAEVNQMALLESIKIPLGTPMPDFELKDAFGKSYKSAGLFGERGLLVVFTCNHCPYALAVWPRLIRLAQYGKGMRVNASPLILISILIFPTMLLIKWSLRSRN